MAREDQPTPTSQPRPNMRTPGMNPPETIPNRSTRLATSGSGTPPATGRKAQTSKERERERVEKLRESPRRTELHPQRQAQPGTDGFDPEAAAAEREEKAEHESAENRANPTPPADLRYTGPAETRRTIPERDPS